MVMKTTVERVMQGSKKCRPAVESAPYLAWRLWIGNGDCVKAAQRPQGLAFTQPEWTVYFRVLSQGLPCGQ